MTTLPTPAAQAGTYSLGDRRVNRMGYGAMRLTGPGVFGPPADWGAAVRVLQDAVELGVNHIDTADFYGPQVANELIREALQPYPEQLVIVTKVGAFRAANGKLEMAQRPDELKRGVQDNLRHLGVETLDVVNLRVAGNRHGPTEESIAERFGALVELQRQGVIRHLGLSNVTAAQVKEAQGIAPIVCVQNLYNIAHRADDALIDDLAAQDVAYVPYFPLGGFTPLQSDTLAEVSGRLGASPNTVALAWLLRRSPNMLLIPGTSSAAHLRENVAAASLHLPDDALAHLNGIGAAAE